MNHSFLALVGLTLATSAFIGCSDSLPEGVGGNGGGGGSTATSQSTSSTPSNTSATTGSQSTTASSNSGVNGGCVKDADCTDANATAGESNCCDVQTGTCYKVDGDVCPSPVGPTGSGGNGGNDSMY